MTRQAGRNIEVESLPQRVIPSVDLNDLDAVKPDVIECTEQLARQEYLDALAFNEEIVTICLHRGREEFSPPYHDFYVNGVCEMVPVDRDHKIKRKFVEVMARAQAISVRTESREIEGDQSAGTVNQAHRSPRTTYSFVLREDKNSKGGEPWLAKIRRES